VIELLKVTVLEELRDRATTVTVREGLRDRATDSDRA